MRVLYNKLFRLIQLWELSSGTINLLLKMKQIFGNRHSAETIVFILVYITSYNRTYLFITEHLKVNKNADR